MAYNYFPVNYQPYQLQQFQQQQQQNGILWVSNEQEAYCYPVAPNNAVALWDSTRQTVYLKQADASGKPSIKIYDLTERAQNCATGASGAGSSINTTYALKSDIDALRGEIDAIKAKVEKRAEE